MVLYELITLQPPIMDSQPDELEQAYLSGKRPLLNREVWPHIDQLLYLAAAYVVVWDRWISYHI